MKFTSIRVTKETLERLKNLGKKEETYDEIINRLIENSTLQGKKK